MERSGSLSNWICVGFIENVTDVRSKLKQRTTLSPEETCIADQMVQVSGAFVTKNTDEANPPHDNKVGCKVILIGNDEFGKYKNGYKLYTKSYKDSKKRIRLGRYLGMKKSYHLLFIHGQGIQIPHRRSRNENVGFSCAECQNNWRTEIG